MHALITRTITAALFMAVASGARASSPAAWSELYAKASAACIKASPLSGATVRRERGNFEGTLLLMLEGRHTNGTRGQVYCLHDKVSGKTEVTIAETVEQPTGAGAPKAATGRTCWSTSFGAQLKTPRPIGTPCTAKNDEGDVYDGVVRR